jgi:holo-[acyl-carrier protein] synthase
VIIGLGVDLVEIGRMQRAHARFGGRLAERLLHPVELDELGASGAPARLLARRFAVKEAAAKALRTGIGQGVSFREIATTHDAAGAPALHLEGAAERRARALGVTATHVSLADERGCAVAVVLLERGDASG